MGIWQDERRIAAQVKEYDFRIGQLDDESARERRSGIFSLLRCALEDPVCQIDDVCSGEVSHVRDILSECNTHQMSGQGGEDCRSQEEMGERRPQERTLSGACTKDSFRFPTAEVI